MTATTCRADRPMSRARASLVFVLSLLVLTGCGPGGEPESRENSTRNLLIVLDGLRPDYVVPHLMPTLYMLGQRGVVMNRHHAVFPTVTRVNASSISTGAYPETHGLLGNSVFFPVVDASRFLNTGDRANLLKVETEEPSGLLSTVTLGEALQSAGQRLLVASAGSSGSSYLLNHSLAGGAIFHYDYSLPEGLHSEAIERLGPVPEANTPNHARNRWVVDAFLEFLLPSIDPPVTVMWLSDPDTTAHQHGVGHPLTGEALFRLDAEIDRIQAGLEAAGLLERTNIWVTSDHGFSQHTGMADLNTVLAPFSTVLEDGTPRIVAGPGAIYVNDGDPSTVEDIVAALQETEGIGAVFTRAEELGSVEGAVPGTLSFDVARWDHDRSAQILYSADWTDDVGDYGFAGMSAQGGVAGHGSSSPFDIHNVLVAVGPDLKAGATIDVPTGNVDFAPTFLHLLGLEIPSSMSGRVMLEALHDEPADEGRVVETSEVVVATDDGRYSLTATLSTVGGSIYLDYTTVERAN